MVTAQISKLIDRLFEKHGFKQAGIKYLISSVKGDNDFHNLKLHINGWDWTTTFTTGVPFEHVETFIDNELGRAKVIYKAHIELQGREAPAPAGVVGSGDTFVSPFYQEQFGSW